MSYDVTIDVGVLSSKNAFIAINSDCIDEAYYNCFFQLYERGFYELLC